MTNISALYLYTLENKEPFLKNLTGTLRLGNILCIPGNP